MFILLGTTNLAEMDVEVVDDIADSNTSIKDCSSPETKLQKWSTPNHPKPSQALPSSPTIASGDYVSQINLLIIYRHY